MAASLTRREFLYGLGASVGAVAFSSLLGCEAAPEAGRAAAGPLAARPAMRRPRAKACIFLTMEGGPSHIDTFDPKPKLRDLHLTQFVREGEQLSAMASGRRYIVGSPFETRRVGDSGADLCAPFVHLAGVADEICFYRGAQAESVNHPTAMYHLNTGNRFGGDPAIGSWVTYGLGSLSENLPAFIVLPEVAYPQGGAANWSNGFLPAHYQGTPLRPTGSPILNIEPPPGVSRYHQRESLDLLHTFNETHREAHPEHDELAARMENYELAFRMQAEVPELMNLMGEDARTQVEQGVRFVQVYSGGWDSHDYLERAHGRLIRSIDKPIAGLITDLKRRGMLDETLIVWGGEFGRSPDNGIRDGGVAYGRDHNAAAMALWFAGGGVKAGHTIGATDELGETAVEVVHPLRDVHVTLLHLLGLDDNRLTYFHGGRYKQLSQFGGEVIEPVLG